jgi:membrane fusion protein, multidrug efflux system
VATDRNNMDVNGVESRVKEEPEIGQGEAREPWPEEIEEPSRGARARSFLRVHPAAKLGLLLAIVALLVIGVAVWRHYTVRESTDDAQIDGHIASVSSRVGGTVLSVNVDDNQLVQAGQILLQLDRKDYEVALSRAKGELADAQAAAQGAQVGVPITSTTTSSTISTAQSSLTAAQQEVEGARAREAEAQARYSKASSDLKRMQQLIARDEISQQQYDAAVTTEEAARAALQSTKSAVSTSESKVAQAKSQLTAAETGPQQVAVTRSRAAAALANVQTKAAAVQQAELNLQYTIVRAPYAGIVSKRSVEPGQVVQAGQPLFAVVNLDDLWVTANYKETQLKNMRPGQYATIHVDTYDRDFRGHVDSFGGATGARFSLLPPENATGNYVKVVQRIPVKLVFDRDQDPGHMLRPGMSAEPTVITR